MQNWRVANPEFDRNMSKIKEHGALDFFVSQTESPNSIISQDLRDRAFQSIGNTVQLPVINYDGNVTVGSARTCTIADAENTSALYSVVFSTYQVGFTMVPAAYSNNELLTVKTKELEKAPTRFCLMFFMVAWEMAMASATRKRESPVRHISDIPRIRF